MEIAIRGGIVLSALLISAGAGAPLIAALLRRALRTRGSSPKQNVGPELLRGGTWIGILERLAVTAAVLTDEYSIVAVVVAVKGFGRFDQLKGNPAASEKFVVGTLASLLWAGLIGAAGRWALSLV